MREKRTRDVLRKHALQGSAALTNIFGDLRRNHIVRLRLRKAADGDQVMTGRVSGRLDPRGRFKERTRDRLEPQTLSKTQQLENLEHRLPDVLL